MSLVIAHICHKTCDRRRGFKCGASGELFEVHVNAGVCPLGRFQEPSILADLATAASGTAALWISLHQRAASFITGGADPDPVMERAWLADWEAQIPACHQCRAFYSTYVERLPPDFSCGAAYFAWAVDLHNAVNAKLGKVIWSEERAAATYLGARSKS